MTYSTTSQPPNNYQLPFVSRWDRPENMFPGVNPLPPILPDLKQNESLSLQHIRKYESDATGGYNAVNQGGAEGGTKVLGYYGPFGGHEKHKGRELTNLTLAEIQALQDDTGYAYDEPGWQRWYNDGKLNAVGAYQFNKPTLSDLIEKSKLPPYTKFTPAVQDYLGIMLLRERGVQPWVGPFNKANPQELLEIEAGRTSTEVEP